MCGSLTGRSTIQTGIDCRARCAWVLRATKCVHRLCVYGWMVLLGWMVGWLDGDGCCRFGYPAKDGISSTLKKGDRPKEAIGGGESTRLSPRQRREGKAKEPEGHLSSKLPLDSTDSNAATHASPAEGFKGRWAPSPKGLDFGFPFQRS